jgi:hypothetical protein
MLPGRADRGTGPPVAGGLWDHAAGLVKHAAFLEKVWVREAVTGRSRAEIGVPATSGESFVLQDGETIAAVRQAHRFREAGGVEGLADLHVHDLPAAEAAEGAGDLRSLPAGLPLLVGAASRADRDHLHRGDSCNRNYR